MRNTVSMDIDFVYFLPDWNTIFYSGMNYGAAHGGIHITAGPVIRYFSICYQAGTFEQPQGDSFMFTISRRYDTVD